MRISGKWSNSRKDRYDTYHDAQQTPIYHISPIIAVTASTLPDTTPVRNSIDNNVSNMAYVDTLNQFLMREIEYIVSRYV